MSTSSYDVPSVGADPLDDLPGVVAQVAAGLGVEGDARGSRAHSSRPRARRRSVARSRPFWTLPVTV